MNTSPASKESDEAVDNIVIGDTARIFLERKHIMPSQWDLPPEKVSQLLQANIRLTVVCWPASQFRIQPTQFQGMEAVDLIAIDKSVLDCGDLKLEPREHIAMILHEIGHVLNPVPRQISDSGLPRGADPAAWIVQQKHRKAESLEQTEMSADEYARVCGYGVEIASSLEKLVAFAPKLFELTQVQRRVQRIKDDITVSILPTSDFSR